MRIALIRHGETKSNENHKYCGKRNDDPLTKAGIYNLEQSRDRVGYPSADIVFTSPKIRSKQTADVLFKNVKQVTIDEFDEIDFGDFEGKSYHELNGNPLYQKWIDSNGEMPFPNGDNKEEYCKNVVKGFYKALENAKKKDISDIAIVVHGGTIMALMSTLAGMGYFEAMVANGGGYYLETVSEGDIKLKVIGKL